MNIAQKFVALEAGLDASRLARFESGKSRPPPPETVARVLEALKVDEAERAGILTQVWVDRLAWEELGRLDPQRCGAMADILSNLLRWDPQALRTLGAHIRSVSPFNLMPPR